MHRTTTERRKKHKHSVQFFNQHWDSATCVCCPSSCSNPVISRTHTPKTCTTRKCQVRFTDLSTVGLTPPSNQHIDNIVTQVQVWRPGQLPPAFNHPLRSPLRERFRHSTAYISVTCIVRPISSLPLHFGVQQVKCDHHATHSDIH